MSRVNRLRRSRTSRKRLTSLQIATRFLLLSIVIGLLGVAGALLFHSMNRHGDPTAVQFNLAVNPSLNPLEAIGLSAYLDVNRESLDTPVSSDASKISFEVISGQNARQVADALVSAGLISDANLFTSYLRYYGLDRQLEAGTYMLAPNMTIPEIAVMLTHAAMMEITVRITEGWRREQIADWIDQQTDIPFSGAEFLAASGAGSVISAEQSIADELPDGATLEGFLFPDTYRIAVDATAIELINKMLLNFDAQVTPQLRADANNRGLSLYQAITLAAIVEREAVIADERPTIASVYLNRLAVGMKLEADPTVQYAMGYQEQTGQWWNLNLTQNDYITIDSPYNTYLYAGLPLGPIANPGIDSIRAVIYAPDTPFFFFRAVCDGSGYHNFAVTFDEHVANECP